MLPGRVSLGVVCLALSSAVSGAPIGAQEGLQEAHLKAAFVFRFAHYVEWPAAAATGRTSLDYCVWPPNPFGESLRQVVTGETLAGRPLTVRDLTPTASLSACHVLFVHGASAASVVQRVRSLPVLTVSDDPDFLDRGGIIQLVRVESRLGFDINVTAANRAGLRLSSHLLRLAHRVRGGD